MQSIKKIDLLIIEITERMILAKAVNSFSTNAEVIRLQNWISELKKIREIIRNENL